jgi:GDPmannose 4,6-dehydratase
MKTALIFGITGQDGSYLSELLLSEGYRVVGVKRRSSSRNTGRIDHLIDANYGERFELLHGDITDTSSVYSVLNYAKPDEIYNLAAQSHVGVSFNEPEYTSQVDAIGTLRLLEATRTIVPKAKLYQASTSELFGGLDGGVLHEDSGFNPRSPYAAAKLYAYYLVKQYREAYGLAAFNGILFNHESPRRGENFVSRKITLELARVIKGNIKTIYLGNLNSVRDWGHAKDYVEAMYIMVNKTAPDDYVVATGQCFSVRDFCYKSFELTGHQIQFKGQGVDEVGYISGYCDAALEASKLPIGQEVIKVSQKYFRPLEVPHLLGDAKKFKIKSGWSPKISFNELVFEMVKGDLGV